MAKLLIAFFYSTVVQQESGLAKSMPIRYPPKLVGLDRLFRKSVAGLWLQKPTFAP